MSLLIIIIVLISTLIHATWNFLIKKSKDPYELVQLLAIVSGLIAFPFGIIMMFQEGFNLLGFFLSMLSGIIHVFYFYFLGTAYKKGDLSFVYPIARGTAVALVPLVGFFIINEPLSIIASIGILVVFLGIISLGNITQVYKTNTKDLVLSLIVGITITLYTITDKYAVSLINPIFVFSISSFLGGFISILLIDTRVKHFYTIATKNLRIVFIISVFSAIGYPMVLYAYKYSYVSLVSPLREVSTVFAAIMGIMLLKEKITIEKIVGISMILLGAIFISL